MKKISKIFALISVVLLLVGLTGCIIVTDPSTTTNTNTNTSSATTISTSSKLTSFLNSTTGNQLGRLSNNITATTSSITIPAETRRKSLT